MHCSCSDGGGLRACLPRKLKGESALYAILPSHMEGSYCTSVFFFLWLGDKFLAAHYAFFV